MLKSYDEFIKSANVFYEYLLQMGIEKGDARFVLPIATVTNLYMSCNLRELLHIAKLRTSKKAQWEIRELVTEMVRLIMDRSPELEFMFNNLNTGSHNEFCKVLEERIEYLQEARAVKEKLEKILEY